MGKRTDFDWTPVEGEVLMGHITDAMIVPTNRQSDVPLSVVTKRDTDKKVAVWLSPKMLLTLFNDQRPQLGSAVYIESLGTTVSQQSGRTYNRYHMQTEISMPHTGNDWITDITAELERRSTDE